MVIMCEIKIIIKYKTTHFVVARSKTICSKLDVDILKAVFSNKPASIITYDCSTVSKGLIDSVKYGFH